MDSAGKCALIEPNWTILDYENESCPVSQIPFDARNTVLIDANWIQLACFEDPKVLGEVFGQKRRHEHH